MKVRCIGSQREQKHASGSSAPLLQSNQRGSGKADGSGEILLGEASAVAQRADFERGHDTPSFGNTAVARSRSRTATASASKAFEYTDLATLGRLITR